MKRNPIRIFQPFQRAKIEQFCAKRGLLLDAAERAALPIIQSVRKSGDRALLRHAQKWDGFTGKSAADLRVSEENIEKSVGAVSSEFRRALEVAASNIRAFCELQMPREWRREFRPGICAGQLVRPLESVGCYIPAGRHPLPSTLLMTAIAARVAGVPRIVVCTPRPVPETLAAAHAAGVEEVYALGGAQAIAALAYGTETIAPVAKIVGPGNAYVAAAKRLVSRDTAIDFVAGPTEVLIISDNGNPEWLAADLLAQAEHDPDAAALLLTGSKKLAAQVSRALARQLNTLPRPSPAAASLRHNGAIILVRDRDEAIAFANRFAPEHLCLPADYPIEAIRNAGSIFIGEYSPEAAGDYASGPNHVLPTGGMPRLRGGLSVLDFVKIITVQQLDQRGLRSLAPTITCLARGEGLEAHARSVEIRLRKS